MYLSCRINLLLQQGELLVKEIYLAGGCFWGVQEYFSRLKGVVQTTAGYANGLTQDTNYLSLKDTHHAETVKVVYTEEITLEEILYRYFDIIDPVSLNRQGADVGVQYRTGIYYTDISDLETIKQIYSELEAKAGEKFVVEVQQLQNFVEAEQYHQDYLKKNPSGYCHIDITKADKPLI